MGIVLLDMAISLDGDKVVCVAGGVETARQFIDAGLLDEIQIHLVSIVQGDGLRLFDRHSDSPMKLERTRVVEGEGVTHLRYRIVR